jgi:hypothetical protein
MTNPPFPRKSKALVRDLLLSERDAIAIGESHNFTLDDLAAWIDHEPNVRLLAALARLGDLQAQLLLSRYRLAAANRLIRLATSEGEGDLARKACVDLLKLDLAPPAPADKGDGPDEEADEDLRRTFYSRPQSDQSEAADQITSSESRPCPEPSTEPSAANNES